VLKKQDGSMMPETGDIAVHLAEIAGPPLMPSDPSAKEKAAAVWAYYDATDKEYCCEALPSLSLLNPILCFFPAEKGEEKFLAARPALLKALASLEKDLGEGPFFGGELPSYADMGVFHLLDLLCTIDGGKTLSEHGGKLQKFYGAFAELPAVKAYLDSRPGPGDAGGEGSLLVTGKTVTSV
jgi:glutathione S-transferase